MKGDGDPIRDVRARRAVSFVEGLKIGDVTAQNSAKEKKPL